MAKGITEAQVHDAADALVTAGERPTVERIRAFLGTGSPNTVTRCLDTWWQRLGDRLTAQQMKVDLPQAPAAVSALASQFWEAALATAHAQATAALDSERAAVSGERATLDAERARQQRDTEAQVAAVATAHQAHEAAQARLADAQRLAEQQAKQLVDLEQQRDALQGRVDRLETDLLAMGERMRRLTAAAAAERDDHLQHQRAIEDHAHAEIDRARQETKEVRAQVGTLERERRELERTMRQRCDEANASAILAQRDAAAQRARAEALEQQLTRLGDLPAALKATLAKAQRAAPRRRSPAAKAGPKRPKAPRS